MQTNKQANKQTNQKLKTHVSSFTFSSRNKHDHVVDLGEWEAVLCDKNVQLPIEEMNGIRHVIREVQMAVDGKLLRKLRPVKHSWKRNTDT